MSVRSALAAIFLIGAMTLITRPFIATAQRISDYRDPAMTYEEGWTVLFNGRDLQGWVPVLRMPDGTSRKYLEHEVGEQQTFFVKDGELLTTGEPDGYVRTADVYDNYVFHVEVRFSDAGNSGVLIHVQRDDVWPRAIECQLYQDHMGRIFPIRGATLDGGEMIHAAASPPGQWNTYEVYSEEGRVATVLNGKLVGLASNAEPRLGYVCLQSEGVPAQFRNIKIRRYTPAHHLRTSPRPPETSFRFGFQEVFPWGQPDRSREDFNRAYEGFSRISAD